MNMMVKFPRVNTYSFAPAADLLGWRNDNNPALYPDWKPFPLKHDQWPPDYKGVYAWRLKTLAKLRRNPEMLAAAKAYYKHRPAEFIMHWMDTYDPRREGSKWVPFVFFTKQDQFITFLTECDRDQQDGLVEKCRDAGATWLACAYSIHSWLFIDNDSIGWGSRKQELVDKLGDASSIFEKLRLLVHRLPSVFKPQGLIPKQHLTFMKMINPENGSVITGETGDNIGRGGRTRVYMVDEAAHLERADKVEAALGDTSRVRIYISSVNGLGNAFHRKREAGLDWTPNAANLMPGYTRVFVIDWRDHPEKTQAWYDNRRAKYEREGMLHIFAQEVDRAYNASVSNTIIPYEWIAACVDAHLKIKWRDSHGVIRTGIPDVMLGAWMAGLDVADGGIDRNALALRQSIIVRDIAEWGARDPGVTTRFAIDRCRSIKGIKVQYDSIGLGSNVKSEYNRLVLDEKLFEREQLPFVAWNAGAEVQLPWDRIIPNDEDSMFNKDFFHNMKAQAWWSLRTRFFKTWMNLTQGAIYAIDEMISLDSRMGLLHQLMKELAQPTHAPGASLKMVVDKQPDGMKSPNLGDATVMAFFPAIENETPLVGSYG